LVERKPEARDVYALGTIKEKLIRVLYNKTALLIEEISEEYTTAFG